MGFFDGATDDPRAATRPQEQRAVPGRVEPPEGWVLPTVLPWVRVLGQSDHARIALVGLRCWPEGVSLDLHVLRRFAPPTSRAGLGFPPDQDDWPFRFGLRFSDGRRAIAPGRAPARGAADQDAVSLRPRGATGSPFHRHYDFHLWPLPPKGRLILVVEWPAEKIRETYTELDAGEIRSAAARAVVVWPDLPRGEAEQTGNRTGATSTRHSTSFATSFSTSTAAAHSRPTTGGSSTVGE
ncbi:MAG TPA: hypothetical protein VHW44_08675 [Pseudonocardiaceae bacterium]|jgi:hypothetical protein|nr:hypothetical protein [Pseudonocardiaceae bacterium]